MSERTAGLRVFFNRPLFGRAHLQLVQKLMLLAFERLQKSFRLRAGERLDRRSTTMSTAGSPEPVVRRLLHALLQRERSRSPGVRFSRPVARRQCPVPVPPAAGHWEALVVAPSRMLGRTGQVRCRRNEVPVFPGPTTPSIPPRGEGAEAAREHGDSRTSQGFRRLQESVIRNTSTPGSPVRTGRGLSTPYSCSRTVSIRQWCPSVAEPFGPWSLFLSALCHRVT